jgi:putative oligomerization/nucleic acid binding protein
MKSGTIGWLIAAFFWSIFMGVTAGAIGVGAIFPPLNKIAAPFVCPNGKMDYGEFTSNPLPGTTYTQITWYCQDNQTGEKTELGIFPMTFYSGAFIGLIIFAVVVLIWYWNSSRNMSVGFAGDGASGAPAAPVRDRAEPSYRAPSASGEDSEPTGQDAVARMKTLKEMRAANLISESEYEQKRAEILRDV